MLFAKLTKFFPFFLLLCAAIACPIFSAVAAPQSDVAESDASAQAPLPVDQVVSRLEARNHARAAALRDFEGTRTYRMEYKGFFGTRNAEMTVAVKSSPGDRQFTIESQSGSKFIIDRIFKKLLEGEQEANTDEQRRRTALDSSNYDFAVAGFDTSTNAPAYILSVTPKTDEKFLYRGKIWVDARDFAVTRIEAEPAKSPSMWIKKTDIQHHYEKVGDFWLPAENRTDSSIRFGGHALLSIDYKDYKITQALTPDSAAVAPDSPSGAVAAGDLPARQSVALKQLR